VRAAELDTPAGEKVAAIGRAVVAAQLLGILVSPRAETTQRIRVQRNMETGSNGGSLCGKAARGQHGRGTVVEDDQIRLVEHIQVAPRPGRGSKFAFGEGLPT
jgi:hypothetical protein